MNWNKFNRTRGYDPDICYICLDELHNKQHGMNMKESGKPDLNICMPCLYDFLKWGIDKYKDEK